MQQGWDMNYLGGCLGRNGQLHVTGWLQNGTHGSLGLLLLDLPAMMSSSNASQPMGAVTPTVVGPQYKAGVGGGMLSPLYSMCVATGTGSDDSQDQQLLHIMTTIDNSKPCAGHVYTAYKEVVYYVGVVSDRAEAAFSVLWRNASSDNYSSCLFNNARFGTDIVAVDAGDKGTTRVLASYRSSQMVSSAKYEQHWPLVEVSVPSLAHRVLSSDISSQFAPLVAATELRSVTVTAMDTRGGTAPLLYAIIGSAVAPQNFAVVVLTRDFATFGAPFKLDAPWGIGDTIHANQPNKNGGSIPGGNLFVWWGGRVAGSTAPPQRNDFLRFRMANVTVQTQKPGAGLSSGRQIHPAALHAPGHLIAQLPVPVRDLSSAAMVATNTIYLAGGCLDHGDFVFGCDSASRNITAVRVTDGAVVDTQNMSGENGWPAVCSLGNLILVAGGGLGNSGMHATGADVLDTGTGQVQRYPHALAKPAWGMGCAVTGAAAYFAGGCCDYVRPQSIVDDFHFIWLTAHMLRQTTDITCYNPRDRSWTRAGFELSVARESSTGAAVGPYDSLSN